MKQSGIGLRNAIRSPGDEKIENLENKDKAGRRKNMTGVDVE